MVKCIWGEDACILYSGFFFFLQGVCYIRNFYLDAHQWAEFIINMLEQGSVCVCVLEALRAFIIDILTTLQVACHILCLEMCFYCPDQSIANH